jgi:hypothetical protein
MTEHKHAEVLRAIADGKEVEFWIPEGKWLTALYPTQKNPITYPELEWRIKPEPKPPIVLNEHLYLSLTGKPTFQLLYQPNIRFTFDPNTKLPIKVELI